MKWISDLIQNPFVIASISAWIVAQVLKTIVYALLNHKLELNRLFGDGGMPSGHSATVTSLATMSALVCGTGSFEFAAAGVLAVIVCHDAMGVRLETGKQAVMINEIVKSFEILTKQDLPEVKLKEFVGHTPIQVLAGILIGIADAFAVYYLLGSMG